MYKTKHIMLCAVLTILWGILHSERREIQIIKADAMRNHHIGDQNVNRLIGDVMLLHNSAFMTCDSAYLYPDQRFEAFGNVEMYKDTIHLWGNYLDYRAEESTGKIRGKIVTLLDGKTRLRTKYIDFNTDENSAHFWDGGVIDNEDNLLESMEGTYYSNKKLALFYSNVEMRNDQYRIRSDSMHYYTERELARFFRQTYMWGDSIFMACRNGYYDQKTSHVFLADNVYSQTSEQEAWSDSAHYYRDVKTGYFYDNIQVIDSAQRIILFGDYARLTDEPRTALVTRQPSAAMYGEKPSDDTLFVRSDTMFAYSIPRSEYMRKFAADTLAETADSTYIPPVEEPYFPEDDTSCIRWEIPCLTDEKQMPSLEKYMQKFAVSTDYSYLWHIPPTAVTPPYPVPLRADAAFTQKTIELLAADTIFEKCIMTHLASSALFERHLRQSLLIDSIMRQNTRNAALITALQEKQSRDSVLCRQLSEQHRNDSAAHANLQANYDRAQQTVDTLLKQHSADSAVISRLQSQHRQDATLISKMKNRHSADMALIYNLQKRLEKYLHPENSADTPPPFERYAQAYYLTLRSKADSVPQYSYSPIEFPADSVLQPDTAAQDTMVRHFLAYRNVRFFHRDMQGKCDSFIYVMSDSAGEMHRQPVVWNDNNQINADRINISQKNNQIDHIELIDAAFMASADDSVHRQFNQIKGDNMLIHFADNEIYRIDVFSKGQTVYYLRDNATLSGVQQGASANMVIHIKNQKMRKIDYLTKPETKIIPPKDINIEEMTLKGFVWQANLRPATRREICQRRIIPSFRTESSRIPLPLFPVYEQIILLEKSRVQFIYPMEAGVR